MGQQSLTVSGLMISSSKSVPAVHTVRNQNQEDTSTFADKQTVEIYMYHNNNNMWQPPIQLGFFCSFSGVFCLGFKF